MTDNLPPDEELLRFLAEVVAALRGDDAARRWATDEIYRRYAGRMKQYLSRGATTADADDMLQEVFIRILRHGHKFRGGPESFLGWFWRIASNVRFERFRSQDPAGDPDELDTLLDPCEHNDPAGRLQGEAVADCVSRHFADFQRAHPLRALALAWLHIDELSYREIAPLLDKSEGAARTFLYECKKKLAPLIKSCLELIKA